MDRNSRKAMFNEVDIYPVTCEKLSAGRTDLDVLDGLIAGGTRIVQLREKEYSDRQLYALAVRFREITAKAGVLLMINDRVDIALAVGADGVHLGQDNLPFAEARKIAPDLLIGASTHSLDEALAAQAEDVDYINIGPIFPTKTKEGVGQFLGPEAIVSIGSKVSVPFTVMGGINESNIDEVLRKGAGKIAMVTAFTKAPDIALATKRLKERVMQGR